MFVDEELTRLAPINDRYQLLRFIGRGGMGEVYEAYDIDLKDHVALKFLRAQLLDDDRALARFRREIRLARKVTHPNVCQVYDVGRCTIERGEAPREEVSFLSMEMLQGETLAVRLRRSGALKPGEALPLITQIASALGAAHDAGVIHRDLKSSNIMLIPTAGGEKAVVMDFGLAQAVCSDGGSEISGSGLGGVTGTPAYMAPEQVEGKEITPAADTYSFGVVIFEMVTGQRPFVGDTAFDTAIKRLRTPPPPPRSVVPDLPATWEAVILRSLSRHPEQRFAHVEDIPAALRGEKTQHLRLKRLRRALFKPMLATATITAVLACAVVLYRYYSQDANSLTRQLLTKSRPAVAVLGFSNLSQQAQTGWLTIAFSEMLSTELAVGGKLRCISGDDIARTQSELVVEDKTTLAPQTLEMVRGRTGADVVVVGSYLTISDGADLRIRLDASIQDVYTGRVIGEFSGSCDGAQLLTLVTQAGAHLREHLGVHVKPVQPGEALRALYGENIEAIRLYAQGIGALRTFDSDRAKVFFNQAVMARSDFALAQLGLARAFAEQGDGAKAQSFGLGAIVSTAILPRENKLWVEGQALELCGEWNKAVGAYRSLWTAVPTKIEYATKYLETLIDAGRTNECLDLIGEVRGKLDPADRENPTLDLIQARAYGTQSDFDRQLAVAQRAEARARQYGMKLVWARALELEGLALHKQRNFAEAIQAWRRAELFFTELGDKKSAARIKDLLSNS